MRNKTSKSVWNNVLENNPGKAEFSRVLNTTPLSRSIQRFIAQSEFKKPYNDVDFVDMEGDWEGPGNGLRFTPGVDLPFNFGYKPPIDPNDIPWDLIFLATIHPPWNEYCPGQLRQIIMTSTEPIVSVELSLIHEEGSFIYYIVGLGTRSLNIGLITDPNQRLTMQFGVDMRAENPNIPGDFRYHTHFIPFYQGDPNGEGDPSEEYGPDRWTGCCLGHEEWYEPEPDDPLIWHTITRMGNLSTNLRDEPHFFRWDDARDTSPCTNADNWVNGFMQIIGQDFYEPGTPLGQPPEGDYEDPRWPEDSRHAGWHSLYSYCYYFIQIIIDQNYPLYQGVIELHMDSLSPFSETGWWTSTTRTLTLCDTTLDDVAGEFGNLTTSNFLDRTSIEMAAPVTEDPVADEYTFVFELNAAAIDKINKANFYYGGTGYVSFCIRDTVWDLGGQGGEEFGPNEVAPWLEDAYIFQMSGPYGIGLFSTCYYPIDGMPDPLV